MAAMRECSRACPTARMVHSTLALCILRAQRALCNDQSANYECKNADRTGQNHKCRERLERSPDKGKTVKKVGSPPRWCGRVPSRITESADYHYHHAILRRDPLRQLRRPPPKLPSLWLPRITEVLNHQVRPSRGSPESPSSRITEFASPPIPYLPLSAEASHNGSSFSLKGARGTWPREPVTSTFHLPPPHCPSRS
jgi:hypothetical protein